MEVLKGLKGERLSDKVGRSALEQLRFRLERDIREMEKIEQQHPDRLAPGLFFVWQRYEHLKKVCEGYAAGIAHITGETAEAVISYTLLTMEHARQYDPNYHQKEQAMLDEQAQAAVEAAEELRLTNPAEHKRRQRECEQRREKARQLYRQRFGKELEEDEGNDYPIV